VKGATIDLDLYVGFRPYVTGIGAFFEMVYSNMFFFSCVRVMSLILILRLSGVACIVMCDFSRIYKMFD